MKTKVRQTIEQIAQFFGYEIYKKNTVVKINSLRHEKMSYQNISRFLYFKNLFEKIENIEGDIVECGVAGGKTLSYLSFLTKYESNRGRKIWAFDSFSGLPHPTEEDGASVGFRGKFNFDIHKVIEFLKNVGIEEDFIQTQMRFVPGFFEETLTQYVGPGIALIHADVDLYKSYKDILETLYPKLVPGGIIAFDEYLAIDELAAYPGAHKAINEYLGDKKYQIQADPVTGKSFFIKK